MTDGSSMNISGLETIELGAGTVKRCERFQFGPVTSGLKMSKFADLYEKFFIKSASVEFSPALGSNIGGTVIIGIDFDPTAERSTFAAISTLSPRWVGAVSSSGRVTIPISLLARCGDKFTVKGTRNDTDCYPFAIHVYFPVASAIGYLTVRYTALFSGQGGD